MQFQCPPHFSWNLFNNPIWLNLSSRSPCHARPFFMDFNVFERKCDYQYVLPINPPNITTLPFQANNSSSSLLSISRRKDLQKDSGEYQLLLQKPSKSKDGNSILKSETTSLWHQAACWLLVLPMASVNYPNYLPLCNFPNLADYEDYDEEQLAAAVRWSRFKPNQDLPPAKNCEDGVSL